MKRTAFAAMALMLTVASCELKAPLRVGYEAPADYVEEQDSTIFGFCGKGSTSNVLQIITSNDDTLSFNVVEARKKGMIMAGYSKGDEIYVVPNEDRTAAVMTINKTHLLGEWVMPSPYDGSTPSGIVLKEGGEAESFEQQGDIIYKSWRIQNGKLLVVETRDDGTDLYVTQTYTIEKMTTDSLFLKGTDESFEYGRYKPEPVIDLGLNFEDFEEDDYNLY